MISGALALCIASALSGSEEASIQEKLSKALKNTTVDKVVASKDIEGLYEVYSGGNIFYTDSKSDRLMLGHLFTLDGIDLTQTKIDALQAENLKNNIDLNDALKIGNGKHEVIVFTDPDCPYCRKSEKLIENGDMTKYIFFNPLDMHEQAKPKAIHVLCSKDPAKEYAKAMEGGLDNAKLLACEEGDQRLTRMIKAGQKLGVQGTPLFYIDGKKINGANPILTELVK